MAVEFKFPDVGEGIHEGEIVRWLVAEGDTVKEDQPIVEVETAKAIVELPSPASGVVLARYGKEGDTIKVGDVLTVVGEKGEKVERASTAGGAPVAAAAKAGPGVVGQIPTEEKGFSLPPRSVGELLATPRVRMLAKELGVDLSKVKGSGAAGQITEKDVEKASQAATGGGGDPSAPQPAAPLPSETTSRAAGPTGVKKVRKYDMWGYIEHVPVKGIRKAVAEHMVKSAFTIPHVTHMDEADVSALAELREKGKAEAEKKGVKLTFLPYILKATVEALKKHPMLNTTFDEAAGEIIVKKYFNIGVAVDTPDGLMLPVVKGADQKDILKLAEEISALAEKARSRKIDLMDLRGGTFSITNIGSFGGTYATPIIAYGQAGNLGIFRMKEKPVVREGKVVIRKIMNFALSFDHRVIDGAEAARFINDFIAFLENPVF